MAPPPLFQFLRSGDLGRERGAHLRSAFPSPLGLGSDAVESLTGYAVRLANLQAVPAGVLVKRGLDRVSPSDRRNVVYTRAGNMNGAGESATRTAEAFARLTGYSAAARLSYVSLAEQFGFAPNGLVASSRRWCAPCWEADGGWPYERKVWWLAVVDACPEHACLLESRCGTCGRTQPSLTRGVRLHVCSYCGQDLVERSAPLAVSEGPSGERLLWYAREGTRLVHAGELAAILNTDERSGLDTAYLRLADLARVRDLPAVARTFEEACDRTQVREAWLEELFSALWRIDASVLDLFSLSVREAVERGLAHRSEEDSE